MIKDVEYIYNAYMRIFIDVFNIRDRQKIIDAIGLSRATVTRILSLKTLCKKEDFFNFKVRCVQLNLIPSDKMQELISFEDNYRSIAIEYIRKLHKDGQWNDKPLAESIKLRKEFYGYIKKKEDYVEKRQLSKDEYIENIVLKKYVTMLQKEVNILNIDKCDKFLKILNSWNEYDTGLFIKYLDINEFGKKVIEETIDYYIDDDLEVISFSDEYTLACEDVYVKMENIDIDGLAMKFLHNNMGEVDVCLFCYLSHLEERDFNILKKWHQVISVLNEKEGYQYEAEKLFETLFLLSGLPSFKANTTKYMDLLKLCGDYNS